MSKMSYELIGKREFKSVNKTTGMQYEGANLYFVFPFDSSSDGCVGNGCKDIFCKPENVDNYDTLQVGNCYKLYFNEYKQLCCVVEDVSF